VPLGINLAGYGRAAALREGFVVGYFARVAPEKGLHVLADAYVRFRRRLPPDAVVRCEAAGYMASSAAPYLERVRAQLASAGLGGEFTYRGVLDRRQKIAFLQGVDVLSVPATYGEPKGMFLLEAMACGVPVVQPRRGAFEEVVDRTGGGVLVEPDSADALADALVDLWSNRAKLADLSQRALDGVRRDYSIQRSADRLLAAYDEVASSCAA
jgi:glycosyltransferase involved in cell wall biosynthesis